MDVFFSKIIIVTINAMSMLGIQWRIQGRVPGVGTPFFGQSQHLNGDLWLECPLNPGWGTHFLKTDGSAPGVFCKSFLTKLVL